MSKKRTVLLLVLLGGNLLWLMYALISSHIQGGWSYRPFQTSETVEIALVGPLTGDAMLNGRAMVRGAQMAIADAKQSGLLKHRDIQLRLYDDQNNIKAAMKMASEISLENDVVAILGHFSDETAAAAGKIYAKHGIPMITGSAISKTVTNDNMWSFGTIAGADNQALSIISHVKTMNDRVSIIYSDDDYGRSLMQSFERMVPEVGLTIAHSWKIAYLQSDPDSGMEKVINDIRSIENPGVIIFATPSHIGATLIAAFKHPGMDYRIVGSDTFSNPQFVDLLTELPQERAKPGYFLDGIYACTPFLADLAGTRAQAFVAHYQQKYAQRPSWVAATYYDAMKTLIEAIDIAHVRGNQVRDDRIRIRTALTKMNSPEEAVEGLAGPLFFNSQGRIERLMMMGTYEHQRFRPAFTQFNVVAGKGESVFKEHVGDKVTVFSDKVLSQKQLVFSGMDINSVENIDINKGQFLLDFYLWFRFKPPFNEQQIVFENAQSPISLKQPVFESRHNEFVIHTFHIKAMFNQTFSFDNFPFDTHDMNIRLHHPLQTDQKLLFLPDYLSLSTNPASEEERRYPLDLKSGWEVENMRTVRNTFIKTFGQISLHFSQLNTFLKITRIDNRFPLKTILPLIMLMLMVAASVTLPQNAFLLRFFLPVSGVLLGGYCHYYFRQILPATKIMKGEYNFYGIYALAAVLTFIYLSMILCRLRGLERLQNGLHRFAGLTSILFITGIVTMNCIFHWMA